MPFFVLLFSSSRYNYSAMNSVSNKPNIPPQFTLSASNPRAPLTFHDQIGVGLMLTQQLGGINGVCFYVRDIFESAGIKIRSSSQGDR